MAVNDIIALRDKVRELPAFESKLDKLEAQIQALDAQISDLSDRHVRARKDAKRLSGLSPQAILLRLTGRFQDKLEEAQQHEHNAKQAYDRTVTLQKDLSRYRDRLLQQAEELREQEQLFINEIAALQEKYGGVSGESAIKQKQLADEREAINKRLQDIEAVRQFTAGTEYMLQRSLDVAIVAYSRGSFEARQTAEHVTSGETEYIKSRLHQLAEMIRKIPGFGIIGFENAIENSQVFECIQQTTSALNRIKAANESLLQQNRYAQEDLLIDSLSARNL